MSFFNIYYFIYEWNLKMSKGLVNIHSLSFIFETCQNISNPIFVIKAQIDILFLNLKIGLLLVYLDSY